MKTMKYSRFLDKIEIRGYEPLSALESICMYKLLSIDYCILTMEIMEIYHKCSSDHDSQSNMGMAKTFWFFPTICQEYNQNKNKNKNKQTNTKSR